MIVILSDSEDESTNRVIEWLHHLKKEYMRINPTDEINISKIDFKYKLPNIYFSVNNGNLLQTKDITSHWYRRGHLNIDTLKYNRVKLKDKFLDKLIKQNFLAEIGTIKELFLFILEQLNNKSIGSYYTRDNNKLIHLSIAKSIGLDVPNTIICTNKDEFTQFYSSNNFEIITKPIKNSLSYYELIPPYRGSFATYTNTMKEKDVKKIPNTFAPSMLQKKLDKKFELRIFYLKGDFYTMAIFSQNNEKTAIDYRRYDRKNPNYNVPFDLPQKIKIKITQFMNIIKLNTGSIDMIYTQDCKYYFLEVNPVGQFGIVSYSCNYNLENKIALELV